MTKTVLILATLVLANIAFAQSHSVHAPADAYQVRYAANFLAGDSVVNLTNVGTVGGREPSGDICANVYVWAEDQQLIACCACPLTPNHLRTLSVRNDLINNTLTPGVPMAVSVTLLASKSPACDAASVTEESLVGGLRAWGTTPHALPSGGYGLGETEFSPAKLSQSELFKSTSYCGFIKAIGSGYGICSSCTTGAKGADRE